MRKNCSVLKNLVSYVVRWSGYAHPYFTQGSVFLRFRGALARHLNDALARRLNGTAFALMPANRVPYKYHATEAEMG